MVRFKNKRYCLMSGESKNKYIIREIVMFLLIAMVIVSLAVANSSASVGTPIPNPKNKEIMKATDVFLTSSVSTFAVPGGAIIDNGLIQLGVNEQGHLNIYGGTPSSGGTTAVGVRYLPTNAEAVSPGCLCEGWGAADPLSVVSGFASVDSGGVSNINVLSFTSTSSEATSTVQIGNTFQVTHYYHPSISPNLYQADVSITNIGSADVELLYRRAMDWDVEPTTFNEFVTIDAGTSANIYFTSNNGFARPNPLDGPSDLGFTGSFIDAGPSDHGALFDFNFGSLAVGATKTFTIYYGAAATEVEAINAITDVGAEAYSFGQPNTPDGPTLGTPNTFIFAFSGVGGAPMELPPAVDINILKFEDLNGNGVQDAGESILPEWSFTVNDKDGTEVCTGITDLTGTYQCNVAATSINPPPYTITEDMQAGWTSSTPNPRTIFPLKTPVNVVFGNYISGEIRGTKWNDLNGDGIKDAGEPGVAGITICYYGAMFYGCTTTDEDGNYAFSNLIPGSYTVYESLPYGMEQTYPLYGGYHYIDLASGEIRTGVDFGNHQLPRGEIHGTKWNDLDGDGVMDDGEPGVAGITICSYGYSEYGSCVETDGDGNYGFTDLIEGNYYIYENLPYGKVQTFPASFWGYPEYHIVSLNSGQIVEGINFGNADASEIHGMKFGDKDGDGVQDPVETGVAWVGIQLYRLVSPGEEYYVQAASTDYSGNYQFTGLAPGFYKVIELPSGSSQTFPANGQPQYVSLGVGEVKNGVDFGNQPVPPGNIQGIKFNDLDGDGMQDAGESGVSGVQICLSPFWSCTYTDSSGAYTFSNVPIGTYWVYEIVPPGKTATTPSWVEVTVNSGITSTVNFGNRNLVPPPEDIAVIGSSDWDGDGVPEVGRGSPLTITKDLTKIGDAVSIKLTLKWSDGTTRTADMTEIGTSNVWTATFDPYFPSGTAQMTFEVDINPLGSGAEDVIEIGDIVFRDPSGQIKDACTNAPIDGASATLLVEYPPTTGNFIVSPPAYQIPETNPLTTGADGMYSWLTVAGNFKVRAEKAGYITAESAVVTIPPVVTGLDISLTPELGCGDLEKPVIDSVTLYPVITIAGSNIEIKVSASDNVGVTQVTADGNPMVYSGGLWKGSITATSSLGSHTISIIAKDAANNEAVGTADYKVVLPEGGIGLAILPTNPKVSAGSSVDIIVRVNNTENFDDTFDVTLKTYTLKPMDLSWSSWSPTNLQTVAVKAKSSIDIPMTITVPSGTAAGSKLYTIAAASKTWITKASKVGGITVT